MGVKSKRPVTFAGSDGQPLPEERPPPGPLAVTANAVVEHSNGEISASYKIFDDKGQEMAPEGRESEEAIYIPSQLDSSQPEGSVMFSIALEDAGTLPNKRHLLKRKVRNHLGEPMYPDGKRLRKHLPPRAAASVGVESEEGYDDSGSSSPPIMTIDLPPNFRPLHPSLRPRRKVVVPLAPTHLETSEPFFMAMMKMVGIMPGVVRAYYVSMDHRFTSMWRIMGNRQPTSGKANDDPMSPNEATSDLIDFLNFLVDEARRVFPTKHVPRSCRELDFSYAGDNFVFGRLRRHNRSLLDVVCIIDCAPVTASQESHDSFAARAPPSRLLSAAARQFARSGNLTHIFGMTFLGMRAVFYYIDRCGSLCSTPLDLAYETYIVYTRDLKDVDDMAQFTSIIISFCFMRDADFGINPLFEPPEGDWPRKDLTGSHVALNNDTEYVVKDVITCSRSLFGLGSALYSAHKASCTPFAEDRDTDRPRLTHTFRLQWHSRPWTSTQPLYELAGAAGVGNLAEVEEAVFGECIGDGFRWFAAEDLEERYAADARPRLLSMKPVCMPLSSVTDPGHFRAAFMSLVKAHRDLYVKAGILHRDVSIHSMLVDASNPTRGIIAGLDLALRVTTPPSWEDEILPLGDSTFQSIDLGRLPIGKPPPEQRYRYDLESFFFVLIWSVCEAAACVSYEERWHGMDMGKPVLSLVFGYDSEQDEGQPDEDLHEGEMIRGGVGEWRSDSDIHELKTRLIILDQYALDDEDDYRGDDFSIPGMASTRTKKSWDDRMHDRLLHSSLARLPYGFGERWILPLQELFRDGYTARRIWCEQKAAAVSAAAFSNNNNNYNNHNSKGKSGYGYNQVQSVVFRVGEFDGDTLGGHVTYDKFMRILESWGPRTGAGTGTGISSS